MSIEISEAIVRAAYLKHVANYPLDQPTRLLSIVEKTDDDGTLKVFSSYIPRGRRSGRGDQATELDLEFHPTEAYLNWVCVVESRRHQGYGFALYKLAEDIVREVGLPVLRQTPSGRTPRGESRLQYLKRKLGYVECQIGSLGYVKYLD